ncbi:hypothetical protein C8Q75DRAFT_711434 [Abortiporus biennis]|nr:hypothetical protein C8Q75DRAFT_711434 [Abortiporus biennis]
MDDFDFPSNEPLYAESSRHATQRTGLTLVLPPLSAVKALKAKKKSIRGFQETPVKKVPRPVKLKPLKEVLTKLIHQIKKKDDYAFFLTPVDVSQVPGYTDIVKTPMDFGTISVKVERGRYRMLEEFATDVRLVTTNAKLFNPPGSIYYTEADRIEAWALDHIGKAAGSVIEFESDWNIDIEHDDVRPMDDDEDMGVDKGTPMDQEGRGRSPSVASTQTPTQGSRKGKGKKRTGITTLTETLEEDGHMPGFKDGVGVFPPGSDWAELMLALKIKGKRYRTKKERMRIEKGGPPYAADGSLDYAEMEDPFTILSTFVPDPPSAPVLTQLYPPADSAVSSTPAPFPAAPQFAMPVNLPIDRSLPEISISPKKSFTTTPSKKRRYWTVSRNNPTRSRAKENQDEELNLAEKNSREPHAVDWGSFATLVGQIADESKAKDISAELGSAEKLLGAIRQSLNSSPATITPTANQPQEEFWQGWKTPATEYIGDLVYGNVDGYAYIRSLAEFMRRPDEVVSPMEVDTDTKYEALGMPLASWVEQNVVDSLTEGRHRLLREASFKLYHPSAQIDPAISTQVDLTLHFFPDATANLTELRALSSQKLDMASLIRKPEELFIADSEWAGASFMAEKKKKIEDEREKALVESPEKNAADYLAFAIQSHKDSEAPPTAQETREVLAHALEYSADMIRRLASGTGEKENEVAEITTQPNSKLQPKQESITNDTMDIDHKGEEKDEDVEMIVDGNESSEPQDSKPSSEKEESNLRNLRLNLLALAKRAPLDTVAKLPSELVPPHIRPYVPTIESSTTTM